MSILAKTSPAVEFEVWACHRTYIEEPAQAKLMATFRFLMEAIDYAQYSCRQGIRCVLRRGAAASEYTPSPSCNGYDLQDAGPLTLLGAQTSDYSGCKAGAV